MKLVRGTVIRIEAENGRRVQKPKLGKNRMKKENPVKPGKDPQTSRERTGPGVSFRRSGQRCTTVSATEKKEEEEEPFGPLNASSLPSAAVEAPKTTPPPVDPHPWTPCPPPLASSSAHHGHRPALLTRVHLGDHPFVFFFNPHFFFFCFVTFVSRIYFARFRLLFFF